MRKMTPSRTMQYHHSYGELPKTSLIAIPSDDDNHDGHKSSTSDPMHHHVIQTTDRATWNTTASNPVESNTNTNISLILYHPTIVYILITETAERFTYYGFRAILIFYFMDGLQFKESTSIALYGYNSSITYFTPLIGAVLADNYYGRYYTILYFGMIYILGLFTLTYATTTSTERVDAGDSSSNNSEENSLLYQRGLSFMGLFLICLGTGGIKPCVSSFGADQLVFSSPQTNATQNSCDDAKNQNPQSTIPAPRVIGINSNNQSSINFVDPVRSDFVTDSQRSSPALEENTDMYHATSNIRENDEASDAIRVYFNYFYFCINIGAITSIAIIPYIRHYSNNNYTMAFGTTLICMILAMILFYSKHQHYIIHRPRNNEHSNVTNDSGTIIQTFQYMYDVCVRRLQRKYPTATGKIISFIRRFRRQSHHPTRGRIRSQSSDTENCNADQNSLNFIDENGMDTNKIDQQLEVDANQVLNILPILAMFPIYSCLYDQQGSVWTIQATNMYLPFNIQPEQMNMINPLLIMIFIPLFDQIIYPYMQHRCHISIAPLRLMSWAMLLTALAFTCSGIVDSAIEYHNRNRMGKVHVMWQLPQIVLLAVGEIFLSVTGLEFAYAQSPTRLKAFVTALYLSTTGIGDLLAGLLYSTIFATMKRSYVMHICSGMMLCNMRIFMWVAHWYESQSSTLRQKSDYSTIETREPSSVDGFGNVRLKSEIELTVS